MKEVSTRALDVLFGGLRQRGIRPEALVADTGISLPRLRNKHERLDWSEYCRVMANARKIWSPDELVALGGASLRAPFIRPIAVIVRLLFSMEDTYRWVLDPGKGAGNQIFTCIRPTYQKVGPNQIVGSLTLDEGYEPCPEFFVVVKGSFIDFPRLLGLAPAMVEMVANERSARYQITFPRGGGTLAWVRKLISWPFTIRSAAKELKEAHEQLQTRYHELASARNTLALQATQLSTAHTISQLVRGDLDLERTLAAVASALVEVAGFAAAEVRLETDLDGQPLPRSATAGKRTHEEAITLPLEGRERMIGEVALWPAGDAHRQELRELLQFVMPTLSMAVVDALTYHSLADYRHNLEIKVEQRTEELRQAGDALTETVARMEQAQQARDRIFANINHEIRTPLTLIQLAVADIRRRQSDRLDDRSRRELDSVDHGVRRLLRLVDGLLLLAAAQEKKLRMRAAPFDVAVQLQLIVSAWTPAAEGQGLSLAYRGPRRCSAHLDEPAFERVITNLISNAIKFTPRGGSVDVELEEDRESLRLSVRDTGIGIDDEFRSRMFGRFEQGRPAVRPGSRGSGIGLSLVKEIAEAHGGSVAVDSPRGGGSLFVVTLPRQPVPGPEAPAPVGEEQELSVERLRAVPDDFGVQAAAADPAVVVEAKGPARATLLVAEDEPALRMEIAEVLREKYRVLLAPDGLTALRLAQRHLPDLLVSDIGMPGMDGLELTRRFRELPGNRLAPVVLLTAFAHLGDRLAGFEAGAIDYVVKPFDPSELLARIRSQLALRSLALQLHHSEKLAALGTLSAGLAHELRNPANAIANAVDPLRELLPRDLTAPDQPVGQLLAVLKSCGTQVALLSKQLLGFKREGALSSEEVPFPSVLCAAVAQVNALHELTFHNQSAFAGTLYCAAPLMTQVLANLLENATHAAGKGGWVRLATRTEGDRLIVEVSDSGTGVPPELRERIFEPFFTTKPPGCGTGLGLTTSREIAIRHGGILEVRDAPNGSLFHLEVPGARLPEARQLAGGAS